MNVWHPVPAAICSFVEHAPGTLLLENSRHSSSALSRVFANPIRILQARTPADVANLFTQIDNAVNQGHFAAGFFSYECGASFEPHAALRPVRNNELLAWFGIYERCCRFDHTTGRFLDDEPTGVRNKAEILPVAPPRLSLNLNEQQFAARIAQIHEWIRAGDVYQLNFTFPVQVKTEERPAALYTRLRAAQPVDYGAFLHCQAGQHVLSLSPELFFRVEQIGGKRRITTQPMKGTARRGRTTSEDREIARGLANDPKNCAENVMIVDLIRNDLGRVCTFGSVHVEKLFDVERYPTLWQMTSTVTGDLRSDIGYEQIFRALFPCGSITGAPKIRAMQLLSQIEDNPRGIYTGAIGFFSREQSVFNVAIRTIVFGGGHASMGVGGGIVIDSEPESEFRECRLKAEFVTRPVEPYSLIETMLWDGSYPFIDLHLDRLADSADYFAFSCDRTMARSALLVEAAQFSDQYPRKVRLLLEADGSLRIESEIIREVPGAHPVRICIATERTDPNNRFLFHKTTHRELYNDAFAAASGAGFADVLFLNKRGEITEGAISNVLMVKDGRWYTPPVACGALPGVFRRHLLETRRDVEERVITLEELRNADAVYICNAVRGLRQVQVSLDSPLA